MQDININNRNTGTAAVVRRDHGVVSRDHGVVSMAKSRFRTVTHAVPGRTRTLSAPIVCPPVPRHPVAGHMIRRASHTPSSSMRVPPHRRPVRHDTGWLPWRLDRADIARHISGWPVLSVARAGIAATRSGAAIASISARWTGLAPSTPIPEQIRSIVTNQGISRPWGTYHINVPDRCPAGSVTGVSPH